MSSTDRAELDSALSTLEDLTRRIADVAERHAVDENESISTGLYDVERALQSAVRRLSTLVRSMDP